MRPIVSSALAVFGLLIAFTTRAHGQLSVTTGIAYTVEHEQKSAGAPERVQIAVNVGARVRGGSRTTEADIIFPGDVRHRLPRYALETGGSAHGHTVTFPNWEVLRAQFPVGRWAVQALENGVPLASAPLEIPAISPEYVPKVVNFDELQQYAGGKARFVFQDTPFVSRVNLGRVVKISRPDGRQIFSGSLPSEGFEYDLGNLIAPGETALVEVITTYYVGSPADPTFYWNAMLRFYIKRVPDTPQIVSQPSDITVAEGGRIALAVSATGPSIRYQWLKDGIAISGATNNSLEIAAAKLSDAGAYSVRITNDKGEVVSNVARVVVNQIIIQPTITAEPASVVATAGAQAQFQVVAEGTALAYQWHRNGVPLPGATSATLMLASVRAADAGSYTVTVSNASGSLSTAPATLTVDPVTRISNLSIRTMAGGEAGLLTVGLTLGGESGTVAKPVLLRAIGPTLSVFGVAGALPDPSLAVLSGPTIVVRNDDWSGNALVASVSPQVGAFGIPDTSSKDAASVFPASAGSYTIQIGGTPGGVALAEIYDATPGDDFTIATLRLTNVSALTEVGTGGDILIAGFSIAGAKPRTVLIRAIGPGLAAFGVSTPLGDPQLELYRGGVATPHAANDNWGSAANATDIATVATRVGAFALTAGGRDAAILVTLQPGSYTAQVSGVAGATGKALVEVYEVP